MIKYLVRYIKKHLPEEIDFFDKFIYSGLKDRLDMILGSDFKRITYTKAIDILMGAKKKFEYPVEWGIDLHSEHERYLTEEVYQCPVIVTDYPAVFG